MQVVLISQLIKNQVEKELSHFLDKNVASSLLALEQDYSCDPINLHWNIQYVLFWSRQIMLLQHSCTSRSRAHDGSAKAKEKKKNWWNFTYCLQKLECCHERWVSPNSASISCWTPLNSLSCFPAWACRIEARHSVCTGDLTHRKWKLWLCMCVCCLRWVGAWGWGVKQDMLGITQSTKSVTWSEAKGWFIWLQKESVACGLEERMFSFFALSVLRHNTWKHFLRGHGSVKKKELQTFYFFSLFS